MRIRWLCLALEDLDQIAAYIAEENPGAASKVVAKLWTAVQALVDQPQVERPGRVFRHPGIGGGQHAFYRAVSCRKDRNPDLSSPAWRTEIAAEVLIHPKHNENTG